jgi:acetyl esterase
MLKYLLTIFSAGALMLSGHASGAESFWEMGPEKVRKMFNDKFMAIKGVKSEVANVTNLTIQNDNRSTPLRIYTPNDNKNLPVILYIHGGAWVAGSLDTHDNLARFLCNKVEALVVSVGYLNAPEGKFPESLEQCYDALLWTVKHAQEFHANADHLAVVGDSAGANMAAAVSIMARDRKGPKIDLQLLINPPIDNNWGGTLQPQGDEDDDERFIATQYVKNPQDANNPLVSLNNTKDLKGLPTALIILAEKDMFRKDGQIYADRLKAAGVPTNVYTQWGVGHLAGNGARVSPLARESIDVAVAALRGEFYRQMQK